MHKFEWLLQKLQQPQKGEFTMGAYAQNSNNTFHTNRKVNMTRKRGGALERRMQKIRGGRIVINHETNTFKIVRREEPDNGK